MPGENPDAIAKTEPKPQLLLPAYQDILAWLVWTGLLGLTLAAYAPAPSWLHSPWAVAGFFLAGLGLALGGRHKVSIWGGLALAMLSMALGCWGWQQKPVEASALAGFLNQPVRLEGVVLDQRGAAGRPTIWVETANTRPVREAVMLDVWPSQANKLTPGARYNLTGQLREADAATLPGGFDLRRYLDTDGIHAVLHPAKGGLQLTDTAPPSWRWALLHSMHDLRHRIAGQMQAVLGQQRGALLAALVLGQHAVPVASHIKQAFQQTGLIHLLAASGMNVGIIALVLMALPLPRHARFALGMVGVAAYMGLAGLSASVLRAGWMLEIALALKWVNRRLSGLVLLGIAALFIALAQPMVVKNLGFQLSVLSTFGLITLLPAWQRALTGTRPTSEDEADEATTTTQGEEASPEPLSWQQRLATLLAGWVLVPLVAQLWVTPLLLWQFNRFSWLSVPLNMLALGLVFPLTVLGFSAAALIGVGLPVLATPLLWLAKPLTGWLLALGQLAALWTNWHWSVPSPPLWWLLAAYGGLLTVWLVASRPQTTRWRHGWLAASVALLMSLALLARPTPSQGWYLVAMPQPAWPALVWLDGNGNSHAWLDARACYGAKRELAAHLRHVGTGRLALHWWPTTPGPVSPRLADPLAKELAITQPAVTYDAGYQKLWRLGHSRLRLVGKAGFLLTAQNGCLLGLPDTQADALATSPAALPACPLQLTRLPGGHGLGNSQAILPLRGGVRLR